MTVKLATYEESRAEIHFVRDTVFGRELRVPRAADWDGKDPECIHVVARDEADNPTGTGRMQSDGRIGRLAVLKSWRCRGVGAAMMDTLMQAARERGLDRVYLHAQLHAVPFYEKIGFEKTGAEFMEAGIRHVTVVKCLSAET